MKQKIWILFVVFYIILLSNIVFSSDPFTTPKTCSDIWGLTGCSSNIVDGFPPCNGTSNDPLGSGGYIVHEIYINASSFYPGDLINVTCEFNLAQLEDAYNWSEYIWYNNHSSWMMVFSNTSINAGEGRTESKSVVFTLNSSIGEQRIRCIATGMNMTGHFDSECANNTFDFANNMYDNDDVNFTVVEHLTYSFWNLTNYTTGENITSGGIYSRTNSGNTTYINVSAQWSKNINNAWIEHNGTGTWQNYTISSLFTGNWTNYTLNLSNSSEFYVKTIGIRAIYANDTDWSQNSTSPSLYFNLFGYSKISQMIVNDTFMYNQTPVQIGCKVTDNYTDQSLGEYTVSFFSNNNFLTNTSTNSSGWATYDYILNATNFPQNFTFKCNITDNATRLYNASSQNYNETNVTVVAFGVINECSNLDTAGTTYSLVADITNVANTTPANSSNPWICMNISANNVTLDCQNHLIDGVYTSYVYGIYSNKFNTTVKNCILSDWYDGIFYWSASNGTIQNITSYNSYDNIYIHLGSNNNTLTNVTVYNSQLNGHGIYVYQSNNTRLTNVTAYNNSWGLYFYYNSNNNILTNVTAYNNSHGIAFSLSSFYNNVTNCSIYNSSSDDYWLDTADVNYFRNTNFSNVDSRKIHFYLTGVWFSYNNQSSGELWLKTSVDTAQKTITRKIVNWNQTSMRWNDSSSTAITASYNITGLNPIQPYRIYNNSVLTYDNTTDSSGNLNFTIYLSSEHEIRVELGGFSKISNMYLNQSILYNNTPFQTSCKVTNVNTSQPIENYNVSFYRNNSFLNWSLTNSSGYATLNFNDNTADPPKNYTIKCNITDNLNYTASSENSNTTNLTVLNPYEIQIGDFDLYSLSGPKNKVNLYTTPTIYANVTDAWRVSGAYVNLSYPGNAIIVNLSMSGNNTSSGWNTWNYTFNNSQYPLNTTGTYTIRIIVNNSKGIENVSSFLTFNVTNNYTLDLTSINSTYMRGENVTVQALDINGELVENVSWIVNVTKINQTSNFTSQSTTFNYTILSSDPTGNYSIAANASNNNTGNATCQFNVSNTFMISFTTPSNTVAKGAAVTVNVNNIIVYNQRGTSHNFNFNVTISCLNSVYAYTLRSLDSFTNGIDYLGLCYAPNEYSQNFNITVNASDQHNNTGQYIVNLTTESAPPHSSGGGGGGGSVTPIKNCTDGTSYDQCSSNRPYYCSNGTLITKCSKCRCESGYSCQANENCILTRAEDFNFTMNLAEVEIEQGKDSEIKGNLLNTGNTILNLLSFLNVSSDCCNVSMPPSFELNEKEEKEFTVSIHVPLFTNVSTYQIKIGIGTEYVKKEKLVDILVTESTYRNSLSIIENDLTNLEKEIQDYKKAGINTRNLENLLAQSKLVLSNASSSISNDQINVLSSSISELENNMELVHSALTGLMAQKFLTQNSWLIILLVISIILNIYLVPEVFIPLQKIESKIRKLKDEEKVLVSSRVETEKQYFMRKIDENTFSKMMITKQDNILKLRASLNENEKERTNILTRTQPKEILKWFGKSIKNLPKNIKNLLIKARSKIKKPNLNFKSIKVFKRKK